MHGPQGGTSGEVLGVNDQQLNNYNPLQIISFSYAGLDDTPSPPSKTSDT